MAESSARQSIANIDIFGHLFRPQVQNSGEILVEEVKFWRQHGVAFSMHGSCHQCGDLVVLPAALAAYLSRRVRRVACAPQHVHHSYRACDGMAAARSHAAILLKYYY